MTNEEKELLLGDLCARLPYGVIVLDDMGRTYKLQLGTSYLIDLFYENGDYVEAPIRPYLRPMESMIEEECREYYDLCHSEEDVYTHVYYYNTIESIDWLNKNMFDYRGLIPKGLALEAKEGMYNGKEQ